MKKLICGLLISILITAFGVSVFSAPVVTESGDVVEVSGIDADFLYTESSVLYGSNGLGAKIDWIMFVPGTAWGTGTLGCYVTIKDGTDTGPVVYYSQASDLGADFPLIPIYYHGSRVRPVIDFSASSVGHDTSKVIFKILRD